MHRKFDVRRILTAFFAGIFAVAGTVVAIDAPASAAPGDNSEIDYALSLNSGQALSTPDANALDLSANFTIEFWYKVSSTASRMILNKEVAYEFATDADGKFMYALSSGNRWNWNVTPIPIPTGRWVHVAFTKASTVVKLYFDSKQVWTQTGGVASADGITPSNPATLDNQASYLMIGGRANTSSGLGSAATQGDGLTLDEIKLWNTERTQANIAASMHEKATSGATGLVAYWNFNEGTTSSSSASNYDRSGNNLNLTFFGTPTSSNGNFVDIKSVAKTKGQTAVTFPRTYLPGVNGWTVPSNATRARVLVVGGGGAGGSGNDNTGGGGGGAGGFSETFIALTGGSLQTVKIGQGGVPDLRVDVKRDSDGTNGQNSSFGSTEVLGGGGGAGRGSRSGLLGASSGGSSGTATSTAGTAGQGNAGGAGGGSYRAGGGGGGATSAGSAGSSSYPGDGGAGGVGKASAINSTIYSAGGTGGSSGANNGTGNGQATVNSGNGGAGGNATNATPAAGGGGAYGGTGVVIVAYASDDDKALTTTSGNYAGSAQQVFPSATSQDFTFEIWVKPSVLPGSSTHQPIVSTDANTSSRFYLGTVGSKVHVGLGNLNFDSTALLKSGVWQHIAVTITGTTTKLYINGVLDIETTKTRVSHSAGINFGYSSNVGTTQFFAGSLDQVKIWFASLSSSEVARSMNMHSDTDATGTITGLQNLWDFNGLGNSSESDGVGSADANFVGSPTRSSLISTQTVGIVKRYTFERSFLTAWGGWFYPDGSKPASALIVGAGGGAGKPGNPSALTGGGGGAGAVYPVSKIKFPSSPVPVIVGVGGRGSSTSTGKGTTGGDSQLGTLLVGGGSGGNSFEYVGARGAAPGGSSYVAGGNGGGGRQEAGTSTAGYALGDTAGSAANQTYNGVTFTALNGVAGANDDTDAGTGGLGGQSASRTSSISGSVVEYGKRSSYVHWGHSSQGEATPGSGGSLNYSYAGTITTNTSNNGGDGFNGQVVIATAAPVLYYNFSDRNSTHDATTAIANLGTNSAYTATKINTPTHNYVDGTLNVTGTTYANGSYVDVADINSAQFNSGMTIDFEADFGATQDNWERILDFGTSGDVSSNILVGRSGTSNDIVFEIYHDTTSQGYCKVIGGIPTTAQVIRWTFAIDGTTCKVWKDGVAQTTTTALYPGYSQATTDSFSKLPASNVTWVDNYLAKSNWAADAPAKMALRSIRMYAGAFTADEVGAITYRTVNFDANYSGSTAPSSRYTSGKTTLQAAPTRTGYTFNGWYDNATAASGTLIGAASAEYTPTTTPVTLYADWINSTPAVNVQFDELNFDFASALHVVGTNGKSLNDKVLFRNVTTKGGVQVDALVTTEVLSGATIANYESGTGAGGANSYFQVDAAITAANGYAQFKFDFYQHGVAGTAGDPCKTTNTTCAGATKVRLQNVNVSAIDIDYYQWNDFTAVESYTLAGNSQTQLMECPIPGSGTCTARTAPSAFPANMRFQGSSSLARTNDPVDMAIVSYAEIETFRIKFGRSSANNTNYYGVAFKALSWGVQTPSSSGGTTYSVVYDKNGASGNAPSSSTGVVGSNVTLPGVGAMTKTGYAFAGWNTAADGTGTNYAASNVIQMPQGGTTLYAKWTANQYLLTYKLYGGLNGPASEMRSTGATANLSSTQPTRDGAVFDSWNTAADGTGTTYAPGASFTMPGANTTLHAMWATATGTIAYNANNGSNAPSGSTGTSGTTTTAAGAGSMTRTNYTFSGWNTAANGSGTDYVVGANVAYPANGTTTTLYAQWTPVLYSYTYNANGGTGAPAGGSTTAGSTVTIPSSTTTRTGYTFAGWTTNSDGTGTIYSNGGANPSLTMPGSNTVLYAKWTAITYTLTFDVNGGSGGPSPLTGTYGSSLTVASAPTAPAGQKFNGWNTAANGSGSTYSVLGTYQITADATLYAQWVADTVNLFYSANGGSGAPTSTTATANQNTTLSGSAPTRTGFSFSGWTTAANGTGTVYGVSSTFPVPGSDTTLYAKWTPIGYNFIYNANGGSGAPSTVAYFMGEFVVIDNSGSTVRTGYTFAGWNTSADGTGSDYVGGQNFLMSNSNMTMYAKWTSNPYTLTYNGNAGSGVPTAETRNAGSSATLSATVPTRTGFTFNGWNTQLNGSGTNYNASASFTMPTTNATLYAQWTANTNALAYNANNGTGAPSGGTFSFGSTITVSSTLPTRTGYTFLGWNTQANGGGTNYAAADTFSMPNSSVTLYAKWAVLQKTFTYDANGGAGVDSAATYSYGATVTVTSSQPTRAGYSFIGWNTMADGSGTARAATSTFTMPETDVTVYAIWSINAYTVYYNMNGGTGSITPQPGTFGTNVTVSSTLPTRVGYTFSGWNTQADGSGNDHTGGGTLTIPSSNVTLYAKWTAIQYSISYNANGGSGSPADASGLIAGTNNNLSATTPSQTGYVFNGWNTAANGSGQTYASGQGYIVPAANTILYAQWVANTYEVIYNANGGTGAPAAENGATNATVNLSGTSPTRPGYTFVRWNSDISDATSGTRYAPGGSFTVPAGNTILYAIWDLADITVTYDINGGAGTTPSSVTDKYLATVTLAPYTSFSRSGYTFNGWNTAANGTGSSYAAESNFVLPDSSLTLYAQWSQVFYAVEYNSNGGANAPANQFATPGSTVAIPPTEPTKSGFDFDDWTSAGAGTTVTPGATLTMPSSNVVLVANWVARASVPSGQTNGGVAPSPSPSVSAQPKQLKQTVYFKGDSAVLQPLAKKQLKAIAVKAKALGSATKIQVWGRVKETNDKSYDMRLSKARANNVAKYLKSIGVKGIWIITAAGISPENKPISRRVDLVMIWK